MFSVDAYIRQTIKYPFWSNTKWARGIQPINNNIVFVDERTSSARFIYAHTLIMHVQAAALITLTDSLGQVIFNMAVAGVQDQLISIRLDHVYEGNTVRFTSVGFLDYSIGYQWCREK